MAKFLKAEKGAGLVAYGVVVGLVSVLALSTVESVGTSIGGLFSDVGDQLNEASGRGSTEQTSPIEEDTPPPAEAFLVVPESVDVSVSNGQPATACTPVEIRNIGLTAASNVGASLPFITDISHQAVFCTNGISNQCPLGTAVIAGSLALEDLAPQSSCQIGVRIDTTIPQASLIPTLQVSSAGTGQSFSIDLVGSILGFAAYMDVGETTTFTRRGWDVRCARWEDDVCLDAFLRPTADIVNHSGQDTYSLPASHENEWYGLDWPDLSSESYFSLSELFCYTATSRGFTQNLVPADRDRADGSGFNASDNPPNGNRVFIGPDEASPPTAILATLSDSQWEVPRGGFLPPALPSSNFMTFERNADATSGNAQAIRCFEW